MSLGKTRKIHLELLRIVAVYLVVLTHTGKRGYHYFSTLPPSWGYYLSMAMSAMCKIAVPLFLMISGANLIGKDEPLGRIWRKRVVRYLVVLIGASLGMYVYYGFRNGRAISAGDFLRRIYSGNMIVPYWFLYAYLGYLMMLPLLRRMIRGMSRQELWYLLGMYLVFRGIVPMAQYRLSAGSMYLNQSMDVMLFTSDLVLFPALGYHLEERPLSGRWIAFLWSGTVMVIGVTVYMTQYKIDLTGQISEAQAGTFLNCLCAVPTIAVYTTIQRVRHLPLALERLAVTLGGCTFGVYLVEQILRELGHPLWDGMCLWLPELFATLLYVGLVVAVGTCGIWLLRKIPAIRWLI